MTPSEELGHTSHPRWLPPSTARPAGRQGTPAVSNRPVGHPRQGQSDALTGEFGIEVQFRRSFPLDASPEAGECRGGGADAATPPSKRGRQVRPRTRQSCASGVGRGQRQRGGRRGAVGELAEETVSSRTQLRNLMTNSQLGNIQTTKIQNFSSTPGPL